MSHLENEVLSGVIDGELSTREQQMVNDHLAACTQCQESLAELEQTRAFIRSAPRPEISELHRKQLWKSINKARRAPANLWRAMVAVAGTAAAIAAFVGVTMLGTSSGGSDILASDVTIEETGADYSSEDLEFWAADDELAPARVSTDMTTDPNDPEGGAETSSSPSGDPMGTLEAPAVKAPTVAADASANHGAQIARCETIFRPGGDEGARALRYVIGSFEGTPAYLLAYEIPRDDPDHIEVFAVAQDSCEVLYRTTR
jgi:hypothetical protein